MAAPFLFTWQSLISATNLTLTGVSAGDTATVAVIADNGGNTLASQSWFQADVVSATGSADKQQAQVPEYAPIEGTGHEGSEFFFMPK